MQRIESNEKLSYTSSNVNRHFLQRLLSSSSVSCLSWVSFKVSITTMLCYLEIDLSTLALALLASKHLLNYQGNMSRNENETNSSCPACYSHTHLLAMFLLYTTLPSLSKHSYCDATTMDQDIRIISKKPQKGLIKLVMRYSLEFQETC